MNDNLSEVLAELGIPLFNNHGYLRETEVILEELRSTFEKLTKPQKDYYRSKLRERGFVL